jgi:hypothetical protein
MVIAAFFDLLFRLLAHSGGCVVLTPAQDFLRERFPPRAEVTSTKTVLKFFLASPSGVWLSAKRAPQKEIRLTDSRSLPEPQSRRAIRGKEELRHRHTR